MADHIRIAAVLRIIYSVIQLAVVAIVFFFVGGVVTLADLTAGAIVNSIFMVILTIMGLCALPGVLAGWGMLYYHSWARVLNIVLCFFDLFAFPVGTALGVYSLVVLFHPEVVASFERGRPPISSGY